MLESMLPGGAGRPVIGQWYARADTCELFQVVGRDEASHAIEIQVYDGNVDEIEIETWRGLPLERIAPPEDWSASMDALAPDDMEDSEAATTRAGSGQMLQTLRIGTTERWEEVGSEDEHELLGERALREFFRRERLRAARLGSPDCGMSTVAPTS